jgi:pimeloyl-ACP methyl ester carboxylesterase
MRVRRGWVLRQHRARCVPQAPLGWLQATVPALHNTVGAVSAARVALAWEAFEAAQARVGGLAAVPGATFKPPELPPAMQGDLLPPSLVVQAHYLQQHCFVAPGVVDNWLGLVQSSLATRPVSLVHGLADAVCHPEVSAALAARWPHAALRWVEAAGHDMDAAPMRHALTEAAREWVAHIAPAPARQ